MASSRASGNPPPTANTASSSDTFLNRKKKEIIDKSMDLFQKNLDRCLDQCSVSAAAPGGGGGASAKRLLGKRARSPDEADDKAPATTPTAHPIKTTRKKRVKPSPTGPQFACPFCKHDPAKYRNVKTCCGPGWEDVHRVKEHVYRNHSSKNYCSRCLNHFDNEETLKAHQRSEVPCKLERSKTLDAITDSQEKQLRTRAKAGSSEEDKWREMYRVIFPKAPVPSPYYDTASDSSGSDSSSASQKSRFLNAEDCKEYLRTELPRIVRIEITQVVNQMFEDFQEKVNQRAAEIMQTVQTRIIRTFQFQEDQAAASAASPPLTVCQSLSSPPPAEMSKVDQLLEELQGDQSYMELCNNMNYSVEELMAGTSVGMFDMGGVGNDSAYYTGGSDGNSFVGSGIYHGQML
ncbi:hypothetical protein QBC43DRAFT_69153 [Cladorrhinum sp. PSN259]|nr:hypothetical protein QBC43DRAFT_69153 [Cladorrhinum sp. PSN259]